MRERPWRRAAKIAAIVAATLTMCAVQVIAGPTQGDQTRPSQSAAPSLDATNIVMSVIAAASVAMIVGMRWHRLHGAPARPAAFTPLVALFLAAATLLAGSAGLSVGQLFGLKATPDAGETLALAQVAKVVLIASAARMLGVAAYAALLARAVPPRPDHRMPVAKAVAIGVAGLLLTWPLVSASLVLAGRFMGAPTESIAHDTLQQLKDAPVDGWFIIIVVCVVLAAPIIEEVMYRGLIQQAARQVGFSAWPAIAITSGVFALAHAEVVQPYALVGLFVLSLGFGWAYEKTGRLWAPIVMHALFNAGNVVLARVMAG